MATDAPPRIMTADMFLALPTDDGVERMLIRGKVWEKPYEFRDRWHASVAAALAYRLCEWSGRTVSRGAAFTMIECRLRRRPDTVLLIDTAYVAPERLAAQPSDTTLLDGPPTLAVEILSLSDKVEEIQAKLDEYLAAGVPLVWVVDPHFKTVTVYRPGRGPEMLHGQAMLVDEAHLPGLNVAVADLFPSE